jgi:2,4-dienoyl-CoA reductase (NADPH2)
MHQGVDYRSFESGHLNFVEGGDLQRIEFDSVVVCAGQTSFAPLVAVLTGQGKTVQQVGGALDARKLDAQRAIREGLEAAYSISEWA